MGLSKRRGRRGPGSGLFHKAAQGLVAKHTALKGHATGPVHSLLGVTPGEGDHPLEKTVRTDPSLAGRFFGPRKGTRSDVFRTGKEVGFVRLLAGWLVGGAIFVPGREGARTSAGVHPNRLPLVVDPHQPLVPVGADFLPNQPMGD